MLVIQHFVLWQLVHKLPQTFWKANIRRLQLQLQKKSISLLNIYNAGRSEKKTDVQVTYQDAVALTKLYAQHQNMGSNAKIQFRKAGRW